MHNHLGSGTFGIKHIKETLKFFHNTLLDEIHLYNKRILTGEAKIIDNNKLPAKKHAILGILGTIMGGRYQWFEERRRQIVRAVDKHDRPSGLPPHKRLQIGRHHQR